MFEKTLQDLVKGIRAHRSDPGDFISTAIAEIKLELRSIDPFIKAQAVRKLTYLQMIGYDMSWAAFTVIEVMTSSRFGHKRIGYLAANQTFTEETEVILLTTNHLKKEFASSSQYDVGLAVNCLANIATPDLSRDLLGDASNLLTHQRPYVRKKALLVMYKLFIKYPQGLRLCFDRIKERLDDTDSGVVSCAVNIICELADKNPRNYLALAPRFFKLLTTSSNNWMLIKVVKLLGSLVPEEPRLARKLLEPLATIIQNTAAKSLLYECIQTVTLALPFTKKEDGTESRAVPVVVKLCSDHLKQFIQDPDQNLKYLGLVGCVNLMVSHPRTVLESRELVVGCLTDNDVTIRTRALELLAGMVTKRTLEDLVVRLLGHVKVAEGSYRDDLVLKIMEMCSKDKYSFLADFKWYAGVLVELCRLDFGSKLSQSSTSLASQLMDISLRVESVRPYVVESMATLLLEWGKKINYNINLAEILSAAAWIIGEYSSHLEGIQDPNGDSLWARLVEALLKVEGAELLSESVQSVFVHNVFKIFICASQGTSKGGADDDDLASIISVIDSRLEPFERSSFIEVQERACLMRSLLTSFGVFKLKITDSISNQRDKKLPKVIPPAPIPIDLLGVGIGAISLAHEGSNSIEPADSSAVSAARKAAKELYALSAEVMKPINPRAQSKVPLPDDVNLEMPLDASIWNDFLSQEFGNSKHDLSNLSFTKLVIPIDDTEPDYDSYLDAPPSEDYDYKRKSGRSLDYRDGSPISELGKHEKRGYTHDPFYLGSRNASSSVNPSDVDVSQIPIARLTSKDLEDENFAGAMTQKRKSKKHSKAHKNKEYPVESIKVVPEDTIVVSSDDDADHHQHSTKRMGRKMFSKSRSIDDTHGLSAIDITTPLGEDEKIPEQKHRQVDIRVTVPVQLQANETEIDKKHYKKEKHKRSSGKRRNSPQEATTDLLDLIDFTADSGPNVEPDRTTVTELTNELLKAAPTLSMSKIGTNNGLKGNSVEEIGKKERKKVKKGSKKSDTKTAVSNEYLLI